MRPSWVWVKVVHALHANHDLAGTCAVLAVVGEGIGNASAGDKHILIQRALQNTGPPSFHGKKKKKATTCLHGQTAGPGWLGGGAGKCRLWNETETRGMDASGRMGQPNAPFRSMQLAGLAFLPA
ncbi:hypothetical protein DFJ77DRAFT_444278 [Powellomyces hirtus]|nr:hypothetical protein DFJ77DRAFT_444278 [Powellomyces hirtus]